MPAYAAAHLRSVQMGEDIVGYLRKVDATLPPFNGRFLTHGKTPEVMDGEWPGHLVLIEFPDLEQARGWYHSPAYQAILPLRTRNSDGSAILVEGVDADYRAVHFLESIGLG
ncbi:DUF1330 domain-containing protein [Luteolibacter sp. Populi]|uniref:DUF1330 domain-containing protein n=1 Tax=Luteolibacter sp. Populi TaxID=3230487 RepID=UPI003467613E